MRGSDAWWKFKQEEKAAAAAAVALGSLFRDAPEKRPSQWKTYGRATQMTPRPGRGGRW